MVHYLDEFIKELKNEDIAKIFTNCLNDSYENNKILALDILKTFQLEMLENEEYFGQYLEKILEMSRSHKPPDSVSAGYHVKFLSLSKVRLLHKKTF